DVSCTGASVGEEPQEIGRGHVEIAVSVNGNPHRDRADDSHFAEVNFDVEGALLLKKPQHGTIVFPAQTIEQGFVLLLEFMHILVDAGKIHHWVLRIDTVETDWEFESIPWVPKASLSHIHFADFGDFGEGASPIEQRAGKCGGCKDCFGAGANHNEIGGEPAGDGDTVIHGSLADAKLHQHEHNGDDHSGGGYEQFYPLVCELSPRDQKT
ncbi:MAG: hypothetical protein RLZZ458_1614, partial [Planctomycetota bacterium]